MKGWHQDCQLSLITSCRKTFFARLDRITPPTPPISDLSATHNARSFMRLRQQFHWLPMDSNLKNSYLSGLLPTTEHTSWPRKYVVRLYVRKRLQCINGRISQCLCPATRHDTTRLSIDLLRHVQPLDTGLQLELHDDVSEWKNSRRWQPNAIFSRVVACRLKIKHDIGLLRRIDELLQIRKGS